MSHERFPKPCRILRRLGRCKREQACGFPLGLTGCFSEYENETRTGGCRTPALVEMLDMTTELHEQRLDNGKKVQVFDHRVW